MSEMNYIDGAFVYEDVHRLAREHRGQKVIISWLPENNAELIPLTPRIRECIKYYRQGLHEHMARHCVDDEALIELRTEVYVAEDHRMYVRAYAVDNLGKEHEQFVWS